MPSRLQQIERKQHRQCIEVTLEDAPLSGSDQFPPKVKKKSDSENARFKPRLQNLGMWREGRGVCQLAAITDGVLFGARRIGLRRKLKIVGLGSVAPPWRLPYARAGCHKRSRPPCI